MLSIKSERNKELICLLVCFIIAVFFCLVISEDTSPLYDRATGDTSMFYMIGKGWTQGILPYSGLFDQKGPIIYLINGLGHLLTHTVKGVFYIQCVFLTFTLYISYRFIKLKWGGHVRYAFFIIFLFSLIISYGSGNNVEEYLLPFLFLSFYCIYKYFINTAKGDVSHPLRYALLYGFTIAFCYLTRLTNALGLCAAILFIAINLGINCKWRNLWANVLVCFIGFAIPVGISFLYFYSKGTFSDMWWATMTFAFGYLGHSGFQFARGFKDVLFFFIPMLNMFAAFCISVYSLTKGKTSKLVSLCWIASDLATFLWIIKGNGFSHYCMVALPFYFVAVLEFHHFKDDKKVKILFYIFLTITVLAGTYRGIRIVTNNSKHYDLVGVREDIKGVDKLITKEDRNSFCGFNCSGEFYVQSGIMPAFPYFMIQNSQSHDSPLYKVHIRDAFQKSNVSCIIVNNDIADKTLYGMIKARYHLTDVYDGKEGIYYIYKKN